MTDRAGDAQQTFEYELDAPPAKVWRAVTIPEYREHWLPNKVLADQSPLSIVPGEMVRYALRDEDAPFRESEVTFELSPADDGGTLFRIIHRMALPERLEAANSNSPPAMMRAA